MSAAAASARGLAALALAGALGPVHALSSCTVTTLGVAFGSFAATASGNAHDGSGSITVACVGTTLPLLNVPYTVSIGASATSGSFARALGSAGGHSLGYQLYVDAARSVVWGDGSGGTATVAGSVTPLLVLVPASATHTVYGRVPAGPMPVPGAYTDTLTVTIDY